MDQAPLSMGFSRQEHRSGLLFPFPGDLPDSGIEPGSPALQKDSLPSEPPGKFIYVYTSVYLHTHICSLVFMGLIPGHPWKQKFGNASIPYIKCHNTVDSPYLQVLNP